MHLLFLRKPVLRLLALLLLGIFSACPAASAAAVERRVALVIGNSAYQAVTALPNPVKDADAIAQTLQALGFEVTTLHDAGFDGMRRALREFGTTADGADVALVYYAGHGMEVNKQNYLIPIDAKLSTDKDIEFEAVPLDLVMNAMEGAKTLKLVLLDACRNNPFATTMKRGNGTRAVGRGLAIIEPNAGTLVSYAARDGSTADDGNGEHSPYTTALLSTLQEPGLEINLLFRKVRDEVMQATNFRQEPFSYASLPGRSLYLNPPLASDGNAAANQDTGNATVPSPAAADPCRDAAAHWAAIEKREDRALFADHIKRFGDCAFAGLAQVEIDRLDAAAAAATDDATTSEDTTPDTEQPAAGTSILDSLKLSAGTPTGGDADADAATDGTTGAGDGATPSDDTAPSGNSIFNSLSLGTKTNSLEQAIKPFASGQSAE